MDGQEKRRRKPQVKRLTNRERILFKNLSAGMTISDAALRAGYTSKHPRQAGHQAIERIRLKAPELLAKHGLTDDVLIDKYLRPALEAHETKFFQKDGVVTDQRDVIAWGPRLTALDMTNKIRGLYAESEADASKPNQINVLVINSNNRPKWDNLKAVQTVVAVPGLTTP